MAALFTLRLRHRLCFGRNLEDDRLRLRHRLRFGRNLEDDRLGLRLGPRLGRRLGCYWLRLRGDHELRLGFRLWLDLRERRELGHLLTGSGSPGS